MSTIEIVNRGIYNAYVNFSGLIKEEEYHHLPCKVMFVNGSFTILESYYDTLPDNVHRYNINGVTVDVSIAEVYEFLGMVYCSYPKNTTIIANGRPAVFINNSNRAEEIIVKYDGDELYSRCMVDKIEIPAEVWVGKKVMIADGKYYGVTGDVVSVEDHVITFANLSREIGETVVYDYDIEIVPPIGRTAYVKTVNEMIREFGADNYNINYSQYTDLLIKTLKGSHFLVKGTGERVNLSDGDNTAYNVPREMLKYCEAEGVCYTSINSVLNGDTVYFEGELHKVILKIGGDILIQTIDEKATKYQHPYTFGLYDGLHSMHWVSYGNLQFIEHTYDNVIKPMNLVNSIKSKLEGFKKTSCAFSVGDTVTIRGFEEMITLFGARDNGEPNTKCRFTSSMTHLCGRTARIKTIDNYGHVTLTDWDNPDNTAFCFSTEMLVGGDAVTQISREDFENAIKGVTIGDESCTFSDDILGEMSLAVTETGEVFEIVRLGGELRIQNINDTLTGYIYLNTRTRKDIIAIVSVDNFHIEPDCSKNVIWTRNSQISSKDVELLTDIKIVD